MITIKARVVGENIELLESPLIASKSRYTVQLDLEFDEAWDGFGRTALFWGVDDEVYTSQITNGKTTVPHEALADPGKIKFGVYGTNGTKRIVTVKVTYKVVDGAYTNVSSGSVQPSPDLLEQIEAGIGVMEDYAAQMTRAAESAVQIAQGANTLAAQAVEKATTAENDVAEQGTQVEANKNDIETLKLQILNAINGGYVENGVGYFTMDGRVIFEMTGMGGGGSGGGGGESGNNAHITMTNTSGWMSKTIADSEDATCPVSFNWTSIEDDLPTGNGSLTVRVSGQIKTTLEVPQGDVNVDVVKYLNTGSNIVSLTVSDIYGNNRTINVTVTKVVLTLASAFDASTPYSGAISFPYTPTGNVQKTVHFILDGNEIGTQVTSVSGRQQSFTIPQQSHGSHSFRVYFEAVVNGQTVQSNELYYEIIAIDPLSNETIIVSSFNRTQAAQYETVAIDYTVYDPTQLEAPVTIKVNGTVVSTGTVDRTTHEATPRLDTPGTATIVISSGTASKTFTLTVTESEIHPEAVTDQLSLFLSAAGRANMESNPAVWEYGSGSKKISAQFTGFNWTRDGWVKDDDGQTCLRTMGGSSVYIPALVFDTDFVTAGKTIEIEFCAHDCMDYDATIISCMNGGRGFEIKADNAAFKSTRGDITCRYGVEKHMRLTFTVQPRSEYCLMYLYIDGEYQGIKQYTKATGSFAQVNPVGISIGSADCAVDIYSIRVYDRYLTSDEVLMNFIADRQDVSEMISLYRANDIKDEYGNIVISKLTTAVPTLPYGIFEGPESPQYKGDKKTVVFDFWDTVSAVQRRLHADGVSINVQGTSSQYYAVKNYKFTFKNGVTVNGVLLAGFTIHDGEIMVDEFTMKADVASSESANNDILEILYNDLSKAMGILTPPQTVNRAVRVGIDGFPCVYFWNYGDGPEFVGKYNFNNDKGTFPTFGFTDGDEAWDVRNNSSQLTKYRTTVLNPDWYTEDLESIFPEEYSDSSRILPMTEFIYSTWQDNASGDELPTPITYGGVEYTHDTAAYRLAKFKAEFPDWWDLDNQAFYYVFTLVFLMVDSRQKNEHIVYWHELGKWWDIIWDCDTALGNDNRGNLTFEYWMEDTDIVASTGEDVFNGSDNVKWVNFRQAFWAKAADTYQRMRSSGMLNAEYLKRIFHEWQAAWPKAIWNEDGDFKYAKPVRTDNDTQYLSMAYGSKGWQRDEFIDWRIPYCDSLFDVGDALLSIMFRPYYEVTEEQRAAGAVDITIDVYKKSYVTVMWDSTKVSQRVVDSYSCTVRNPLSSASDSVCAIHNGKMIKDVHGMENLYVGYWDSTNAPNLQALRLGSAATGYINRVTKEVNVGANRKLRLVDMRNCVNFGTDDQKTLNVANCANIQKVYLDGTSAMGVELPNGGVLDTLHLPATTTSIILRNHPKLTDANFVVEGYTNIEQLWLEGMTGMDTKALLRRVPANTAVRITGFYWEATDATEIEGIMDLLDTMRGIEINGQGQGEEVEKAQMSGTIHTAALRGDQIAAWKERYPTINVTADHTSSTLTLKNWDGSSTIKTITCVDGVPSESIPTPPSRTATAQYTYTAVGWNRSMDSRTNDASCVTNVTEDRTVYAAYSRVVNKYTITWKNKDNSTLRTDTLEYGATPSWGQAMPTYDGQTAKGWTPEITTVTGNATYTASYIPTYTATFVRASEDGGGTLYTQNNVQQGTTPTYGGSTPTSTRGAEYEFIGWTPALSGITANTTYTAKFKAPSSTPTAKTADGAYGVEWDYSGSGTTLTRKGLAASFTNPTPATSVSGSGSSPFDTVAPWKDMKRFNVVNGSLVADTDASFSETDNDTVVYIPEFYYTAYKDTTNSKWLWAISPTKKEGYVKHPGSGRYIGRFHTSGSSSGVFTKGGVAPLANTTRANFRTYSHNKGSNWWQMDLATWSAIQLLYLVEFANWHSQDTLGKGQNSSSVKNTGATTGAAYHTLKQASAGGNMYRWIENPFSNLYTFADGFVASDRAAYVSTDNATFGDKTSGMKAAGITLPSSNFITGIGYSEECAWAFIPDAASGGSATTYVPDCVDSSTGPRVLYVGGSYGNNDINGFFYCHASSVDSYTGAYIGSRLQYTP